jgi:hypothetical protein
MPSIGNFLEINVALESVWFASWGSMGIWNFIFHFAITVY